MKDELHPATEALLKHFEYEHLPVHLQLVSRPFHQMAHGLVGDVNAKLLPYGVELDGPELTMALRKLLEAKDCAVRAAL